MAKELTADDLIKIAGKRPCDDTMWAVTVFRIVIDKLGVRLEFPEDPKVQNAFYSALAVLDLEGYIRGRREERAKRKAP